MSLEANRHHAGRPNWCHPNAVTRRECQKRRLFTMVLVLVFSRARYIAGSGGFSRKRRKNQRREQKLSAFDVKSSAGGFERTINVWDWPRVSRSTLWTVITKQSEPWLSGTLPRAKCCHADRVIRGASWPSPFALMAALWPPAGSTTLSAS